MYHTWKVWGVVLPSCYNGTSMTQKFLLPQKRRLVWPASMESPFHPMIEHSYSHRHLQYVWAKSPHILNKTKPTSFLQWRKGRNEYQLNHQLWGSMGQWWSMYIWPMTPWPIIPSPFSPHLPETMMDVGDDTTIRLNALQKLDSSGHVIHQLSGFLQVDILRWLTGSGAHLKGVIIIPSLSVGPWHPGYVHLLSGCLSGFEASNIGSGTGHPGTPGTPGTRVTEMRTKEATEEGVPGFLLLLTRQGAGNNWSIYN